MTKKSDNKKLSRRKMFPLLGSSLLVPFVGLGTNTTENDNSDQEEYDILLRPDGKTVKVKRDIVNKSKVINKSVSNKSLLSWLKDKF